jgi:hypothetical protein
MITHKLKWYYLKYRYEETEKSKQTDKFNAVIVDK